MKWLAITSSKDREENLWKSIDEIFSNNVIYFFASDSEDRSLALEAMPSVDCCLILEKDDSPFTSFVLGWLVGRNIQIFSLQNDIPSLVEDCPNFHTFSTGDEIASYLKENKSDVIREMNRRKSYLYLFRNGMPLTIEDFAHYIEKEDIEICERYYCAGLDINARDKDGTPLLNLACRNQSLKMVEWFLKKGAKIDPVSEDRGYTPLMDAVWKGCYKIASLLISKGANVNMLNKEGQTMIILAVGANYLDICELLVENGADVDIEDRMGMSAYGYASLFKKHEILAILEKKHRKRF